MRILQTGCLAVLLAAGLAAGALAQDTVRSSAAQAGEGPGIADVVTQWRQGPSLDNARAGLSAVEFGGNIYAAGGAGLVKPRDDFEVYALVTGRWRPLSPLPVGLERFGFAAGQERLWLAGGYSADSGTEPIADMWSYDPAEDVWQAETALPGPKAAFSLVALDGQLYAIGGEEGAAGVFVYDIEAKEWSAIDAPPETSRRGAAALVVDGQIWLIGGASSGDATARVDVFDPISGVWRIGPALPEPRAGHAVALHDGAIHVFGGRSADLRRTLDDMLVLELGSRTWQAGPRLMVPRTEAAAAAVGDEIFLIGGGAGSGFFAPFTAVDSVDVLRAASR